MIAPEAISEPTLTQSRYATAYGNFSASAAPTVTDDITEGYDVNSKWYKSTAPYGLWICTDATEGAAVWRQIDFTGQRVRVQTSTATLTPDIDTYDTEVITAQAAALAVAAPTGTPSNDQPLIIRIKDNGTARAITWNAIYEDAATILPTTTVIGTTHKIGVRYNSALTKWEVLAVYPSAGGSGTVTSFSAGDLSPLFTTSEATATTTPALTFALVNQNANIVYAGPTSGGAAAPTFRSLVAADIPSLSAVYQPLDATLTAFAALTIAANSLTVGTGADAFSQTTFAANTFPARASAGNLVAKTITDFALTILDDADAAAIRTTLGIDTNDAVTFGAVTVDNLTVNGTVTTVNSATMTVDDPLIRLADNNVADSVDIGFYGTYDATGAKYTGLFRDASDGKYRLFTGSGTEPTTTVNIAAGGYAVATLVANIESSSVAITGGTITGITDLAVADGGTGISTTDAKKFFVGPTSGGAAAPTWRAVEADDIIEAVGDALNTLVSDTNYLDWTYDDIEGTMTVELKRRTSTQTNHATPTINTDTSSYHEMTAQTASITSMTTNLSGSPERGDKLWIALVWASDTGQTIAWGTGFESSNTVTLPTLGNGGRQDCGFIWNVAASKWRIVALDE